MNNLSSLMQALEVLLGLHGEDARQEVLKQIPQLRSSVDDVVNALLGCTPTEMTVKMAKAQAEADIAYISALEGAGVHSDDAVALRIARISASTAALQSASSSLKFGS